MKTMCESLAKVTNLYLCVCLHFQQTSKQSIKLSEKCFNVVEEGDQRNMSSVLNVLNCTYSLRQQKE